ncbi:TetR/AcrR family transcriptional regulator [Litorivivens lipolytica]|uniref:TetR/AcrR family transcriptional regulator n=1 Tax=Litorivivens lipolytica TaxID=1524264 RepID=A0A7W4W385_9GAMM|nr:TetR/AcrR family transcriptional regulator [Litorivivens lipolytica]MBB3046643.1 TetR/AcrR family transcriptional regulator [Litorivivens lipolytica]
MSTPRESNDTRKRILLAARQQFARNGYAGTRLDDIAEDVGIRRPSLFHHFKDKPTLYQAVWQQAMEEQDEQLTPYFEQPGTHPVELLHLATDAWVDYAFSNPDFVYLSLFAVASGQSKEMPPKTAVQTLDRWQKLIERGIREGAFNPVPLVDCMSLIAGMTSFYLATPNNKVPQLVQSYTGDRVLFANRLKQLLSTLLVKPQGDNVLPFRR